MSWRDSTLGTGAVPAVPASTAPPNNAPAGRGGLFSRHSSFKGSLSYHAGSTDAAPTVSTSYELGGVGAAADTATPSASIGNPLTSLQGAPPLQQLSSPQVSAPPLGRRFTRTPSMDPSSSRKGSTLSWLADPSPAPASTPSPAAGGPQSSPTSTRRSSSSAPCVAPQPMSNGRPATSPGPSTATGFINLPAKSPSLDTPFASTLASPPMHMREMRSYEASTALPAAASGAGGVAATTSGYFPTAPSAAAAAASLAVRAASERRIQRLLHKIDSVCSSHNNVSGPESGSNSLPSNAFLERSDRDRDRDRDRESPASAPLVLTQELQSLLAVTLPALPEDAAAGRALGGVSGDAGDFKEWRCLPTQSGSLLAGTEEEGARRATAGQSRRRSTREARLSPTASELAAAAPAGAAVPPAAASFPETLGPRAADAGGAAVGRAEEDEPCVGCLSVDVDAGYAVGQVEPDMEVAVELTLRPRHGAGYGAGPGLGPGGAGYGPPATGRAAGGDATRGRRTAPGVVLLADASVDRAGSSGSSGSEPRLAWPPAGGGGGAAAGHDAATGRPLLRSGSHDSSSLSDAVDREPSARQLVHASAADRGSRGSLMRMATSASGALLTLAPAAAAALVAAVDWASKPEPELERRSKGAGVGGRRRSLGREAYGRFRSRRDARSTSGGSSSDDEAGAGVIGNTAGGGGCGRGDAAGDGWLVPKAFFPDDIRFSDSSDDDDTCASDLAEAGQHPAGRHHRYERNRKLEANAHPAAAHATAHSARTLHPKPPARPPRQSATVPTADAVLGSSASLASVGDEATAAAGAALAAAPHAAAPTASSLVGAPASRRSFPSSPLQSRLAQAPPAAKMERPSANLEQAAAAPGLARTRRSQSAVCGGGGGGGVDALSSSGSEGKAYGGGGLAVAVSPPSLSAESARPSPGQQLTGVPALSSNHYGEAFRQSAARDLSPPPRPTTQLSASPSSTSLAAVDEGTRTAGGDEGRGFSGAMPAVQPAPLPLPAWGGRGSTAVHPPAESGPQPQQPLQPAISAALGIMAYSADLSARIDAVLQVPVATPGAALAAAQPSRRAAPAAQAGGPSSTSTVLENAATLVALIDEDLGRSSAGAGPGGLSRGSSGLHAAPAHPHHGLPHPHPPTVPHHLHHVPHGSYTLPYGSSTPQADHGVATAPLPHAPTMIPSPPPPPTTTAGTATETAAVDPAPQAQAHMRAQPRALGGWSQRRLRALALGVADNTWAGRTVTPPGSDSSSHKSLPGEVPRSGGNGGSSSSGGGGGGAAGAAVDSSSSGGGASPGRPYDTDLGRRLSMQDHRQSASRSNMRYPDRRRRLTGQPSDSGSGSDGSSGSRDDFVMRLGAREPMAAAGARQGFTPPQQARSGDSGGDGFEGSPHDGLGIVPPHGQMPYMPGGGSAVHTAGGAAATQQPGAASRGAHTEVVRPGLQYRQRSFGASGAFGSIMRRLDEQLAEAASASSPLPVTSLSSAARVAEAAPAVEAEPSRLRMTSVKYSAVGGGGGGGAAAAAGSPLGNAGGGGATYGTAVMPASVGAAGVMQPLGRTITAHPLGGPQQLPGSRTFPPPATTALPSTASSRILLGGGASAAMPANPPEGEPYYSGRTRAAAPKPAAHVVVEEGATLNIDVLKRDLERLLAR